MVNQPLSSRQRSVQQQAQFQRSREGQKQKREIESQKKIFENKQKENQEMFEAKQNIIKKYEKGEVTFQEYIQLFPEKIETTKYGGKNTTKAAYEYISYLSSRGKDTREAERTIIPESGRTYIGTGISQKKPVSGIYEQYSGQGGYSIASGGTGYNIIEKPKTETVIKNFPASFGKDTYITSKGNIVEQTPASLSATGSFQTSGLPIEKYSPKQKKEIVAQKQVKAEYSEDDGYTPIGRFLIKEKFVSRTVGDLEERFLRGAQINLEREPTRTSGTKFVKGAGERGVFPILKILAEPQNKVPELLGAGASFAASSFEVKYYPGTPFDIKSLGGTPQIVLNKEKFSKVYSDISTDISTNPEEFIGGIVGGGIFDAGFTIPIINYSARPFVNISSRIKNAARGVEVGVVEGTTNYNIISKGNESFLLVPDIHPSLSKIPEIGDKPLNELLRQTKAGSGENVRGVTFVSGPLTKAKPGETYLLRQFVEHQRVRESPLYASPEATLSIPLVVQTSKGSKLVLPEGTVLQVGSKQFAGNLSESGYSGIEFGLLKDKPVGILTNEKISRVYRSPNIFEYRREFYSPKYSGEATIQFSNEFPSTTERQYGFQTQGVKYYDSRGSTLKFLDEPTIKADIFNRKMIPFGIGEKYSYLQELYEDIGFGRQFKYVELQRAKVGIPVGRPPSKSFEGEPIYERPTARAIVEDPISGKLLFVREGNQPFLFPGGGVEPINVPGQGKEGIRLAYPKLKDFGKTAARELSEETGAIVLKTSRVPGITIRSNVRDLSSTLVRDGKPVSLYRFRDVARFYKASVLPGLSPRGEIDEIIRLSPSEALARSDVGQVEKEFIRRYYEKQSPSKIILERPIRSKETKSFSIGSDSYTVPRRITLEENIVVGRNVLSRYDNGNKKSVQEITSPSNRIYPKNIIYYPDKKYRPIQEKYSSRELPKESFRPYQTVYPGRTTVDIPKPPRYPSSPEKYVEPVKYYSTVYPPEKPREIIYPRSRPTTNSFRRYKFPKKVRYEQLNNIEQGYGVITKKGGKEVLLPGIFTKQEAFAYGKNVVDKTLRASFRLFKTAGFVRRKGIVQTNLEFVKSKRDPRFLVEPRKRRLSTRSEIKEIKASKRIRRLL